MSESPENSGGIYFGPPDGYVEPSWPALYNPLGEPMYLYTAYAIWRFTVLWTLVFYGILFLLASSLCVPIFARRHLRLALSAPVVGTFFGLLGAFISATVVGYALAALYNAAFLRMSTFVPALWGFIQTLITITFNFYNF